MNFEKIDQNKNRRILYVSDTHKANNSGRTINIFSLLLIAASLLFSGITSYYLISDSKPEFFLVASVFGLNLSLFFIPKQKLFKKADKAELWNNQSKEDFLLMLVIIFYFVCFARIDLIT
jgi:hypothetical protein